MKDKPIENHLKDIKDLLIILGLILLVLCGIESVSMWEVISNL